MGLEENQSVGEAWRTSKDPLIAVTPQGQLLNSDTIRNIMSTAEKRIAQMRVSPKGDWRIEDLESVATALGMKVRKSGGSHAVFSHPATAVRLTVPARRQIKPVYIRHFIDMIDEIRGAP